MEDFFAIAALFVALPWLILHYVTRWKTSATLTNEDENLLEDLYSMARRLDDRMDTVERIIRADNPGWKPDRLTDETEKTAPRSNRSTA